MATLLSFRCKTTQRKPPARYAERRNGTQGRAPVTSSQDDYAFVVGAAESIGGGEIDLKVEGVMLPAVLIDSGASCDRRPRKW